MADLSLNLDPKLLGTPAYGDLLWVDGTLVLTSDVDARGTDPTLQLVVQRLRLFLGEFFMDTSAGVPWLQEILVTHPDKSSIDATLQDVILGTPGVQILTRFEGTHLRAQRSYQVSFSFVSVGGATQSQTVTVGAGT